MQREIQASLTCIRNGLSDPYVVVKRVSGSGSDFKSDVQYKTLNPIWTDLNWQIPVNNTEELRIVVWDYDKLTNHVCIIIFSRIITES